MRLPSFKNARAKIVSSADVAAEIAQHRTMLDEATATLAALDSARAEVMLGDDDKAIRQHVDRSAEAAIGIERLQTRLGALEAQAVEVAAAEAATALEARRVAVVARSAEAAAWLRDSYPMFARELVAALTSLHEVEAEVAAVNIALAEAGRADVDPIPGVQNRLGVFLGDSEGMDAGSGLCAGTMISLGSAVRLPHLAGGVEAPGWSAPAWS